MGIQFKITVQAEGCDDIVTIVVRPARKSERNDRGTDTQIAVFIDGGVLSNDDDIALFETEAEAMAFAALEARTVAAGLEY